MTELEMGLLKNFRYDPTTGVLTRVLRKNRWGDFKVNEIAGTPSHGYTRVTFSGRGLCLHRIAFLFMVGKLPDHSLDVDHINGKKSDNRWSNLRLATRAQNNLNSGNPSNNTTGQKGVHPTRERWFARIKVNRKIIHLGVFQSFEEAVKARKEAEAEYFPGFQRSPQCRSN